MSELPGQPSIFADRYSEPAEKTFAAKQNAPEGIEGAFHCSAAMVLEEVPEELVVHLVVILDFRHFDDCAEGQGSGRRKRASGQRSGT